MKISYIIYLEKVDNINERIKELLDNISQFTQCDFEVLLLNDKTYNDLQLPKEYNSSKYKILVPYEIETLHKWESYNYGIDNCTGNFIKFLDFDDLLVNYVNNNLLDQCKNFDVIELTDSNNIISFNNILENKIKFNNCIFNKSITEKLKYYFEGYYVGCESIKFLLNCSLYNCIIKQLPINNINKNQDNIDEQYFSNLKSIYETKNNNINELTYIIAFRNENYEIERTLSSIRYMCKHSNITIVDDDSDDGFNYQEIANRYGAKYVRLEKRNGSAGAKNYGGMHNDTKYFCFLDGHQRIYHKDLDLTMISYIQKYPKSIFATRSIYITRPTKYYINESDYKGLKKNHCGNSYCCYITDKIGYEWDPKWTDKQIDANNANITRVMCVLGAVYFMETEWFKYIKGLEGLTIYGLEESFMSIKTWLLGGTCYVLKNIGVGHLYRKKNSTPIDPSCVDANRLFLTHVFLDDLKEVARYDKNLKNRIKDRYSDALKYVKPKTSYVYELYDFLTKNRVMTVKELFERVNNKVKN